MRKNTTDLFLAEQLLCEGGEYDFLVKGLYRAYLEHARFVVDAGANIGLFSVICQSVNPKAKFICIEPEKDNFRILKKNMSFNSYCIRGGLWNKKTRLTVVPRNTGEWGFCVKEVDENTPAFDSIGAIGIT